MPRLAENAALLNAPADESVDEEGSFPETSAQFADGSVLLHSGETSDKSAIVI